MERTIPKEEENRKEALQMLEMSELITYDEETLTRQWRKMNLKSHPNRPGGSKTLLTKCQRAYEFLMQSLKTKATQGASAEINKYDFSILSETLPPAYKIVLHDGRQKLVLNLKVNVADILLGQPVHFTHTDGKTYKIHMSPGKWGGWAELPGLGLSAASKTHVNREGNREGMTTLHDREPLLVIIHPLFPKKVPHRAVELIKQGIEIALSENSQSEIVQDWMPALTI